MEKLKTEDRQEQIVSEAMKIIHRNGYMGLSIRELAKQVNVSEAAIYRHFESKEDIIKGILNKMSEFSSSLIKELNTSKDTKERLRNFLLFHLNFFEKLPEMTSVIFSDEILNINNEIYHKFAGIMNLRQTILKEIISGGIEDGSIRKANVEDISMMLQGFIRLTVFKWKLSGFSFSLNEKGQSFIKTLDILLFN